jgi:hypothetical protein
MASSHYVPGINCPATNCSDARCDECIGFASQFMGLKRKAEFVDHDGQQAYKFAANPTHAHPLLRCGDSEWPCQLGRNSFVERLPRFQMLDCSKRHIIAPLPVAGTRNCNKMPRFGRRHLTSVLGKDSSFPDADEIFCHSRIPGTGPNEIEFRALTVLGAAMVTQVALQGTRPQGQVVGSTSCCSVQLYAEPRQSDEMVWSRADLAFCWHRQKSTVT